jgi:aryl-alcohol dehydrogenase-like predicted oxidoreductase
MKRILGKSGIEVSAMGMGCWAIGGPWNFGTDGGEIWEAGWGQVDDAESLRAIQAGLDLGVNLFDTAANYGAGHSEKILGQALKGKRDKAVIATKFGFIVREGKGEVRVDDDQILDNVGQDCEDSLRRLGTDYIDVYQLHQGSYDIEKIPELIEILESLVEAGKIRWYGWSTDDPERAAAIADAPHCTSIQFEVNAFHDNPETRAICAEHYLGGLNKSPLFRGVLTGKFNENSTFSDTDIRRGWSFKEGFGADLLGALERIRAVMIANGHTLAQASLAYIWALDERMVPIPGFKSVKQVQENVRAMELGPLSAEQVGEIRTIMVEVDKELGD